MLIREFQILTLGVEPAFPFDFLEPPQFRDEPPGRTASEFLDDRRSDFAVNFEMGTDFECRDLPFRQLNRRFASGFRVRNVFWKFVAFLGIPVVEIIQDGISGIEVDPIAGETIDAEIGADRQGFMTDFRNQDSPVIGSGLESVDWQNLR